ncbi:universal stress protein [Arthrobacter livingstonensis]|nr:universal stress protein [Arthrobacter livingstonensis]
MALRQLIVAGVDDSPSSRAAVEWAAYRAERLQHSLQLVRAVPDYLVSFGNVEYQSVQDALGGLLESEAARVRKFAPSSDVQTSLHLGEPAEVLAELSGGAAMVVVGTDRTADEHGEAFGAVDLQIAMNAKCPVAVVPVGQTAGHAGVVVGIDGSPGSMDAAYFAAAEAASTGQVLTVIYASSAHAGWLDSSTRGPVTAKRDETQGRMILESAVACLRARHIHLIVCDRFAKDDVPARVLINAARGAEMLVVGSRGKGVVQHALMGSVVRDLLLQVPCPLVLTRPV